MSAPEHRHDSDKWVAEAMGMVGTCVGAAMFGHVEHEQQSLDALRAHLQRQADLMERMGEALALVLTDRSIVNWHDEPKIRAALTAFQESKQ
jgi:hypothetical protein